MFNKELLIKIVKKSPINFPSLARKMNIPRNKNREFSSFLSSLLNQKIIFTTPKREYFIPQIDEQIEGVIRVNARGFGFIDLEDGSSIFIPASNINTAMDNDTVVADIFKDPSKEGAKQGIVKDVIKRYKTEFVGTLVKFGNKFGVLPLDMRIRGKFRFHDESKLKENYEAKLKIVKFGHTIQVELIKLLGHKDSASVDIMSRIIDADVQLDFNPKTLEESSKIPQTIDNESHEGRTDIRDRLIVTIDGDDTKDFDDAIEVKKLDNGNFMLGVHIADVTHYVKENTALDEEAKLRGTSIYLVDRVIPMLPEALSNGICSLNPHVDRFVLSCEMEINPQGETVNYKIYPGIINSKHRLTYKDVNNFYDGSKTFDQDLSKMLNDAKSLSEIIRKYKINEGYIDFEIDEAKIIIDENGKTKDITVRERAESEMMIEDFMVRANETVAFHAFSKELPFIYRVHDKPEAERLLSLQNVIDVLGIKLRIPTSKTPKDFASAINKLKQERFDDFIKIMMLRTMAKAIYSPNNIGHFGLASKNYTHFTSPIRRYPDLMVHRMIRTYFFENKLSESKHFEDILPEISKHSSLTEQKAVELERHVADIKKAEFYEKFVGQEFGGTIVSMLKFGFFVEFPNKVDGLVHVENLIDGKYELDKTGLRISNKKKTFVVGQDVKVVVVGSSKKEGKIDLVLAEHYKEWKEIQKNTIKTKRR